MGFNAGNLPLIEKNSLHVYKYKTNTPLLCLPDQVLHARYEEIQRPWPQCRAYYRHDEQVKTLQSALRHLG